MTFRSNFVLFETKGGPDEDDLCLSMEERLALVWPLTLDAWAFKGEPGAESRLPQGISVPVIGRSDLLANKRALGRPQDLVDATWLEENED